MSDALRFSMQLPAHPVSITVARCVVRSVAPIVDPEQLDSSALVLSEIVTNSVRHGSPGPADRVDVDILASGERLTATVRDGGPAFGLPLVPPGAGQVGGYGLHIAMRLSELTVDHTTSGNTVTFAVAAPGGPPPGATSLGAPDHGARSLELPPAQS